ncbi:MAG: alpha/beta hydrolase fold domain-containing protein [Solirubrobacterales bacterium]
MNPSFKARLLIAYMRIRRAKRDLEDLELFRRELSDRDDALEIEPPDSLSGQFEVSRELIAGRPVFTIAASGAADAAAILYLHGGGHFLQAREAHWWTAGELAQRTRCPVIFPLTALTPLANCDDVLPWLLDVYRSIASGEVAAIAGDSAGAGAALALAQLVREAGLAQPKLIVLFSPWLDLSMRHAAEGDQLDGRDPMLAVPGLIEAGRLWAGTRAIDDPLVSPVDLDLTGLAPVEIHAGTRDILINDARRLAARGRESGHPIELTEHRGLFHVFMTIPMPETDRVLTQVAEKIGVAQGI